ncbi:uveal autoantigen with coiled-coil domains and ankyrin repeats-like isoform X2 [Daktulosphaira vitifoliae]|uniref:uveal autoantigen with coiled-coil domains and ankyrin repeats-like isoform X2 n=1 Tax=Daktulosphaira vitifoliae TaxID=58002 RepID=UPI0021AA62C7|nr:uveal autoantigen with coiled-coil domains and ankyrin repeats-like isoform X2 [Daktulosphaira vitifoliae]
MEVDSIHEINHEELFQDCIDTNIKDFDDIIQENELRNNITFKKNNSPNWIVASLNGVFMWIQKHLNRFFKFDQNLSTKQLKNQINELEKTLTKTIQENQSSQQKKQLEITKLNDLNNYLKNVLSTNASELDEKEDIYKNIIKSLDKKNVKLNEENISLQLETASKMSEMKILKDKIHDFQSKEQKLNQQLRDVMNKYKILEQMLSATIDITVKLEEDGRKKNDELISCENKNSVLMKQLESQNLAIGHLKQQLKSAEDVLLDQKTRADKIIKFLN